jgi:hypothetical protein
MALFGRTHVKHADKLPMPRTQGEFIRP